MEKRKRPVEFIFKRELKCPKERRHLPREKWWNETKKNGIFHCWGLETEEGENEIVNFTIGIVEDEDGQIHTPLPDFIKFLDK